MSDTDKAALAAAIIMASTAVAVSLVTVFLVVGWLLLAGRTAG